MDVATTQPPDRAPAVDPARRNEALAAARARASAAALDAAKAAEGRRAQQLETTRAIIERAIGANTRLAIQRDGGADTFIYQAIDRDSGEVIRQWPPVQFAKFLAENGLPNPGLALDTEV